MSHDVHFWPERGSLDLGAVRAWLAPRPSWTVSKGSALYENKDTGVYLTLEFGDSAPLDAQYADEEGVEEGPITAAINVYRPSFFGLECAIVLADLANKFDLLANDFQDVNVSPVAFSSEWFVARWNVANSAGYRALGREDTAPNAMATSKLVQAWEWNRSRAALQESLGDTIFVPKIMAVTTPAGLATAVVWTDAIPFSLPPVDHVIVLRNELQPRRLFHAPAPMQLQPRAAVIQALGSFAKERANRIDFLEVPAPPAVKDWVRKLRSTSSDFQGLAWDQVHDAELLASAT